MRDLYLRSMRGAAAVLFGAAILIFATTLVASLMVYFDPQQQRMSSQPGFQLVQLLLAVAGALSNAILPFLGAAALWRADRWLAREEATE